LRAKNKKAIGAAKPDAYLRMTSAYAIDELSQKNREGALRAVSETAPQRLIQSFIRRK
jgi:hypothetical protein